MTFVGALRRDGSAVPCVLDGPIHAVRFTASVEQSLVPTVERSDIMVFDDLSSHRAARARHAVRVACSHPKSAPATSATQAMVVQRSDRL